MITNQKDPFSRLKFFLLMTGLIVTLLIDISIVKVYDLVDKNFLPSHDKIILFSVNSFACLFLEFLVIRYLRGSFPKYHGRAVTISGILYIIYISSLLLLAALLGYLIFQMSSNNSYHTLITEIMIITSYSASSFYLLTLSYMFASWYSSNRSSIVLLYCISAVLILSNLIFTAAYSIASINDRPDEIRRYVGGTMNVSVGKHAFLYNAYTVSSILSFASIWITTALLMKNYKDNIIRALAYWIILSLPLIYYSVSFIYRLIFGSILVDYLTLDPLVVSIILTVFLSLSRPIGGLTFGIVFWRISKRLSYEKRIRTYMIISGWGILLLFAANQATSQTVVPYPPFGLITNTALILANFLVLLGIYNSAKLVSANVELRKSIYKHAFESKLLSLIGTAELDREVQKTVSTILKDKDIVEANAEQNYDLDPDELKSHLDFVIREVKKAEEK